MFALGRINTSNLAITAARAEDAVTMAAFATPVLCPLAAVVKLPNVKALACIFKGVGASALLTGTTLLPQRLKLAQRSSPMPTQCSRDMFGNEAVDGREVVAAFDGGEGTTDAGGLLLGATDRAIHLVGRFAACFVDHRAQAQVEHTIAAMVAQRVFGIALGYEDLIDHDQLRHDPGARGPRRQARGQAPELRPARRQEHAQPARARAFAAEVATKRSGMFGLRSKVCSWTCSSRRIRRRPRRSSSISM